MAVAALVISLLALLFTLVSFWWLNARRGSVQAATPQSYAFVDGFRLRLPLAFFNSGAVPLLIADLRIHISGVGAFPWQTTRSSLRPSSDDEHAFGTPFSIRDAIRRRSSLSSATTTNGFPSLVPAIESSWKQKYIRRNHGTRCSIHLVGTTETRANESLHRTSQSERSRCHRCAKVAPASKSSLAERPRLDSNQRPSD